jgi:hypothetical protein
VWISEQTATFALHNIKRLVFITEVESVYSAVRTESLYKTDTLHLYRVKRHLECEDDIRIKQTYKDTSHALQQIFFFLLITRFASVRNKMLILLLSIT